MEEFTIHQPTLIGRDAELAKLREALDAAIAGKGATILIAGEAGIGKTRLASELISEAEKRGVQVIHGWCLAESLEPLMPIKVALRETGLSHLISGDPPPLVLSAYLMNDAGMLISKVERLETNIDSDIFAGMLQAVGNFIQDSLSSTMGRDKGASLNSLGYGDYNILIQSADNLSFAVVIKGTNSEFLIEDMKAKLRDIGNQFDGWKGDMASARNVQPKMSWFVDSGKYDGKFLVDDPKIKQENLFDNILIGLQRASEDAPLMLFLDDMQWSDPTSLSLIHYLSRNTRGNRMVIVGTYRPEDIIEGYGGATHNLEAIMQAMNREGLFEKIELKRLDADNTIRIVESILGKNTFDRSFFEKVFSETEGSPLFILEIIKFLEGDKAIGCDENGVWEFVKNPDELEIPSKIYDVVKRRLNRLEKEQKEILECASIIGEEFKSEILGTVTGFNRILLLKNLSDIEKRHQLIHFIQNLYRFDHAKVKEVLYHGIGKELRREYHRAVGDAIFEMNRERPMEAINELAYHYYEAADKRAMEYLLRAGDMASDRYANREAARFYQNALELMAKAENPGTLEKLGDAQVLVGDFEEAIENFTGAIDASADREMKARNLRKLGDVYEKLGDYDTVLELIAKAKEAIMDERSLEHARTCVVEARVLWRKGDFDVALPIFHHALGIFGTSGDAKRDQGDILRFIGNIHLSKGDFDDALLNYEKSLEVMKEINDPYGIANALGNIGIIYWNRGDMDEALEYYIQSMGIMEKLGDKQGTARQLNSIALTHLNKGRLDMALEYNEKSLRIQDMIGDKEAIARTLGTMGIIYKNKGVLDRALDYFEKSLVLREMMENKDGIIKSLNGIGGIYHIKGDSGKALEYFEKSLEMCKEIGVKRLMIYNYCSIAEIKLELGDVKIALEHAETSLKIAEDMGAKQEKGMSLRVIGMAKLKLGLWEKSLEDFNESKKIFEDIGTNDEYAKVLYEYGLLWMSRSDVEKAREHLEKALSLFSSMGMKLWAEKCRDALEGLDNA